MINCLHQLVLLQTTPHSNLDSLVSGEVFWAALVSRDLPSLAALLRLQARLGSLSVTTSSTASRLLTQNASFKSNLQLACSRLLFLFQHQHSRVAFQTVFIYTFA